MKRLLLLIPVALATWFCSSPSDSYPDGFSKGPGSETTNGLALVDGKPASYATVALRKVDFRAAKAVEENALIVSNTYADEDGNFDVKIPDDGDYRLTVVHDGVAFSKVVTRKDFPENKSTPDTVRLLATALLAGVVDLPEGNSSVWVGIQGTDVLVKSDSSGWFALPAIPANDSLRLYFVNEDYTENLGEKTIYASPRESLVKDYRDTTKADTPKVTVLLGDGSAAAYASVSLRPADFMPEEYTVQNMMVAADFRADDNGTFTMDWPEKGDYRLTVVSDGYAFSKVLNASEFSKLDTVQLVPTASVSSKVTLRSGFEFAWVGVYGLDLLVKTNEVGAYVLPNVPANDTLAVYFLTPDSNKIYAEWETFAKSRTTQFLDPVMVLQDFENGDKGWYLNIDSLKKGTEFKTASVKAGIESDSARASKVFHGQYKLAKDDYAWALVGTSFEHYMNFAAIDSIVFYAKGDGNIRLSLENWVNPTLNLKAATDWYALTSKWQRISVNPAELCVGSANEETCFTTWNAVKGGVKQFHVFVEGGSEFYIDDVILYGALF